METEPKSLDTQYVYQPLSHKSLILAHWQICLHTAISHFLSVLTPHIPTDTYISFKRFLSYSLSYSILWAYIERDFEYQIKCFQFARIFEDKILNIPIHKKIKPLFENIQNTPL